MQLGRADLPREWVVTILGRWRWDSNEGFPPKILHEADPVLGARAGEFRGMLVRDSPAGTRTPPVPTLLPAARMRANQTLI